MSSNNAATESAPCAGDAEQSIHQFFMAMWMKMLAKVNYRLQSNLILICFATVVRCISSYSFIVCQLHLQTCPCQGADFGERRRAVRRDG